VNFLLYNLYDRIIMDEESRRDHLFAKKDFKEWLDELKAEGMSIMMMIIDLQAAKGRHKSLRQAIDPTVNNNITGSLGGRFNHLVKTIGEEGISDGITAAIDDFIEELEKRQREIEWRIFTIKVAEKHPKHDDDSNGPSGAGDEFNVTNITDI
jgi:hypothetical protein